MPEPSNNSPKQTIERAGRNATQVGGNYTQTSSFNINILISVFFISVLALGGLAWAINVGKNEGGNPASDSQPTERLEPQLPSPSSE